MSRCLVCLLALALPAGRAKAAAGFSNNKYFVIPAWRVVVVRLGTDGNVPDAVWSTFLGKLGRAIRPDAGQVGPSSQEKHK